MMKRYFRALLALPLLAACVVSPVLARNYRGEEVFAPVPSVGYLDDPTPAGQGVPVAVPPKDEDKKQELHVTINFTDPSGPPVLSPEDLKALQDLAAQIKQLYVDGTKLTAEDLRIRAMKGMAAQDSYSELFTPQEVAQLMEDMSGQLFGIGVRIRKEKDEVPALVETVFPGSPAEQTGLKSGDIIMEVNGTRTYQTSLRQVARLIKGPQGTQVTVSVRRTNFESKEIEEYTFVVTRDKVSRPNVFSEMLPTNVGYIYFDEFQKDPKDPNAEDTADRVLAALRRLRSQGMSALVLDLRNNGGGNLEAARKIISLFLQDGDLILSSVDSQGQAHPLIAKNAGEFKDVPLKVLVNRFTASASEVTAAALQDHKRARIVGSQTFGKGLVQTLMPLNGGYYLKLTTQRWHRPNGETIQWDPETRKGGVMPDDPLDIPADVQFKAMDEVNRKLFGVSAKPGAKPVSDPALEAALKR